MKIKTLTGIIALFSALSCFNSQSLGDSAMNCSKHPLYCTIVHLNPKIDVKRAMDISNAIYKYSKVYGLDPYRSLAIIAQESMFEDVDRTTSVAVLKENQYEIVEAITDLGMYQFNVNTLIAYKIDATQFKTDLDYSTNWHFKLLKEKISSCKDLGKNAWACYHSRTASKFKEYIRLVNRWYNPLKFK